LKPATVSVSFKVPIETSAELPCVPKDTVSVIRAAEAVLAARVSAVVAKILLKADILISPI
jgi:hypothetical protein